LAREEVDDWQGTGPAIVFTGDGTVTKSEPPQGKEDEDTGIRNWLVHVDADDLQFPMKGWLDTRSDLAGQLGLDPDVKPRQLRNRRFRYEFVLHRTRRAPKGTPLDDLETRQKLMELTALFPLADSDAPAAATPGPQAAAEPTRASPPAPAPAAATADEAGRPDVLLAGLVLGQLHQADVNATEPAIRGLADTFYRLVDEATGNGSLHSVHDGRTALMAALRMHPLPARQDGQPGSARRDDLEAWKSNLTTAIDAILAAAHQLANRQPAAA
jgi:hypothetical protein